MAGIAYRNGRSEGVTPKLHRRHAYVQTQHQIPFHGIFLTIPSIHRRRS